MNYKELAKEFSFWNVGAESIRTAVDAEGFSLRWAMRKPPISRKNRALRFGFAHDISTGLRAISHLVPQTAGTASVTEDRMLNTWRIAFKLAY